MLGILMLVMLLLGGAWRVRGRRRESRLILYMIVVMMLACASDPLVFTLDGHPGPIAEIVNYIANLWQFLAGVIVGFLWLTLINYHITGEISDVHRTTLYTIFVAGFLIMFANIFVPVIFYVDEENVYHRGPLFLFYSVIEILFFVDSIVIYHKARQKGGVLKFFPLGRFLIPISIGMIIQGIFYGISAIWPMACVSLLSLMISLHNENVFRDQLTGLYNRYYLDNLKESAAGLKDYELTVIMTDMNDFKSINDRFGHSEGDEALQITADIMQEVVGRIGTVIRYAGDEFIILLNTRDDVTTQDVIYRLKDEMEIFNRKSEKPYRIEISAGASLINLRDQSISEILEQADARMYADKKKYYEENPHLDRRADRK